MGYVRMQKNEVLALQLEVRYQKLIEEMKQRHVDAVLVSSSANNQYFSGFTGTSARLFLTPQERILFTDFRYTIQAKVQSKGFFEVQEVPRGKERFALKEAIARNHCSRVGFEDESVTVADHQVWLELSCEWVFFSQSIAKLRSVKSDEEIASIRTAQQVADCVFQEILQFIHIGTTELEIANELVYRMRKLGAQGPSFDPIVAGGPNSALCHAVPTQRALRSGDLLVLDYGCKVNGYCSDMTRTVGIGTLDDTWKDRYHLVLQAQESAIAAVKPGMRANDLDAMARDKIVAKGYGQFFGHALGHGVGLDIHEQPTVSPTSNDVLFSGNAITVEPGIYLEGQGGIRIEDCGIVTEHGFCNLVSAPKELLLLS